MTDLCWEKAPEEVVKVEKRERIGDDGNHDQDLPGFQRPGDGFGGRRNRGWRRRRRRGDGDRTPGGSGARAGTRSHERDPAGRAGNHRLPTKVCGKSTGLTTCSGISLGWDGS